MSTAGAIQQDALYKKALELVESVVSLTESLPQHDLYMISTRLCESIDELPRSIIESFEQTRKIDQIRSYISTNGKLAEAKDYLELVQKLKYADTGSVLQQLNEVKRMLDYSNGNFH